MVFLVLGNSSRRAAWGFRAVAETEGGDIGHLMAALGQLSRLYGFLRTLILVVVVLVSLWMAVVLAASLTVFLAPK